MKLSDLKTGMIVTWRNGVECVVMIDCECNTSIFGSALVVNAVGCHWMPLSDYGEDMKIKSGYEDELDDASELDIVKVEVPCHPYSFFNLEYEKEKRKLLWKEETVKELTMAEIEEKFGCKVKIVKED